MIRFFYSLNQIISIISYLTKGEKLVGKIDGKVAVITECTSGIGKATTKLFIQEGARVVMGDIQDELNTSVRPLISNNSR